MATRDAPGQEDIARAFEEAEAEDGFWREHFDDLLARYPKQFVAVADGAVVGVRSHLMDLMCLVEERGLEPRRL